MDSETESDFEEDSSLYERLLADMTSGIFRNGTPLRVQAIAKRYGTSVNPVREVLRRMEGEGLVRFEKNKGATTTTLDRRAVLNIFELIKLVEPYLVAGFAETCKPDDVDMLARIQDQLREVPADDRPRFGVLDMKFHQIISARHYNDRAARTWLNQRQLLNTLTRNKILTKGRHRDVLREHDRLIEAFRANDRAEATKAITEHIEGAGRALVFHLESA
ncbi:GntR family transcriptional regulator [Sulfitobacter sp. D35]|uniref:GntR family transcriptional regulator n=1 Tax=Sulfitobacter sp. D35 TaxID=3083252 RepID=UPI00296E9FB4|nr:GntR family transcriptional regulator [Sulfitobacter sp. D35]MDW4498461.1 GntR family transcriptional regulator [Sulfitobacter sp. D35]